jgi:SAM-dependent methyltransferase
MNGRLKQVVTRLVGNRRYRRLQYAKYVTEVTVKLVRPDKVAHCNICGHRGEFLAHGQPPRYGALCPECGSLERQRLLKLWVDENADRLRHARLLHFAPEPCVSGFLRPLVESYQTADIDPHHADLVQNIEALDLPDEGYDVVLCSHVLEHVNDRKALAELRRVLAIGGFAVVMVPIVEGWPTTYENPAITDPKGREAHFGQCDHVRYYGADLRRRIAAAGFELIEKTAMEPDVSAYGLLRGEKVFVCRKPVPSRSAAPPLRPHRGQHARASRPAPRAPLPACLTARRRWLQDGPPGRRACPGSQEV